MGKFNLDNAPESVRDIYRSTNLSMINAGNSRESAHDAALRAIQHAGFFQVGNQWKQIAPDLREKINTRVAEVQPDGTYLVPDVDVFYPNAVKGSTDEKIFDADKISQAIENTNQSIFSGGQKPSLTIEHPSEFDKLAGRPKHTEGQAINFRPSTRPGMVRCDLVSINPEVIADWKARKYTGLSAGFVADDAGTGLRFGHVALLGGESQALMHLPTTEVYASNNVFFSTQAIGQRNPRMDKQQIAKMKAAHAAMNAAYAAIEAEEPGATEKLEHAKKEFAAAYDIETKPQDQHAAPGTHDSTHGAMVIEHEPTGSGTTIVEPAAPEFAQSAGQKAMWAKVSAAGGKRTKDSKYDDDDMQGMWASENKQGEYMAPLTEGTISYLGNAEQTGETPAPERLLQPFHTFSAKNPAIKPALDALVSYVRAVEKRSQETKRQFAAHELAVKKMAKEIRLRDFRALVDQARQSGAAVNADFAAKLFDQNEEMARAYISTQPKVADPLQTPVYGATGASPLNFSSSSIDADANRIVNKYSSSDTKFDASEVHKALFGPGK